MHEKFQKRLTLVEAEQQLEEVTAKISLDVPGDDPLTVEGHAMIGVIMDHNGETEVVVGGLMNRGDLAFMLMTLMEVINDDVIPQLEGDKNGETH